MVVGVPMRIPAFAFVYRGQRLGGIGFVLAAFRSKVKVTS